MELVAGTVLSPLVLALFPALDSLGPTAFMPLVAVVVTSSRALLATSAVALYYWLVFARI